MVDFGLAKLHISDGAPVTMRKIADFRGTITYASLNAHLKIDLSRRDDMWSFYFVILDFFNENLPWRNSTLFNGNNHPSLIDNVKDEVKDIKSKCLKNPEKYLWATTTKRFPHLIEIFYHIKSLQYEDKPSYAFVAQKLREILTIYNASVSAAPAIFPTTSST